jgi:hypothetical protein
MHVVLEDFYEPLSSADAQQHERGQMWWTCYPYLFTRPRVPRILADGKTREMDLRQFDPGQEQRDEELDTNPGEFLAVTKFKKRPVMILSTAGTPYQDRAWQGGGFFLVAPIRSLRHPVSGEYIAPPEFVWGTMTYQYSSVFYLPRDDQFDIREAVLHLDRMKTLHQSWLFEPRRARLGGDAMICLDEWLRNYIYGIVRVKFNDDLESYRQIVGEDPQIRTGVFGRS